MYCKKQINSCYNLSFETRLLPTYLKGVVNVPIITIYYFLFYDDFQKSFLRYRINN